MTAKEFKWLHLTDLHVGQSSHNWLWPNFKKVFTDDLERIIKQVGGIDALIFSGDLTQKALPEEFESFTNLLSELYERFDQWGSKPLFFSVPGNHDLTRPDPEMQESLLINRWWSEPVVAKNFWKNGSSVYRIHIEKAFKNYMGLDSKLKRCGIPLFETIKGIVPGDISAEADFGGFSVGLVGLNSSFLQIGDGDYKSKLDLDPRQLLAITNNDPDDWCSKHDVNFLITHHPSDWFNSQALKNYETEIYPPGRFTAHMYGHMHESSSLTYSRGAGPNRKNIQGPSIFGLEHLKGSALSRSHGYSVGRISAKDTSANWQLWPRKAHIRSDGARNFIPDFDFAIEPGTEYVAETLSIAGASGSPRTGQLSMASVQEISVSTIAEINFNPHVLDVATHYLQELDQHLNVRVAEQQACIAALKMQRMVWISTDWGLGTDGFLYSVIQGMKRDEQSIYRIDLGNYTKREDFLDKFPEVYGCSFAEFCQNLLRVGPAVVIFDEAPSAGSGGVDPLVVDVERLGRTVLDLCPDIVVVAITRLSPTGGNLIKISLKSLDELETRAYVFSHRDSSSSVKNPQAVSEIYRITEGVPRKIERVLKRLRVVDLAELATVDSSSVEIENSQEFVPRALTKAVSEILDSPDPDVKRSALMLKLLCILPNGETLQKIKRFDSQLVFYPAHAESLLDLELIEVRNGFSSLSTRESSGSQSKFLCVRSAIRDYVQSLLSAKEIDSLNKRAIGLYFEEGRGGAGWKIKGRDGIKVFDDITTLDNAHDLVMRTLIKAYSGNQVAKMRQAISLTHVYCGELVRGKHYRNCSAACDAILAIVGVENSVLESEILSIKYMLAKSVRMQGNNERAKILLEELNSREWPRDLKLSLLMNYAFCLESLDDQRAAVVAEELIKMAPKSKDAIQAKAIVIGMSNSEDSKDKLLKLEEQAKKIGAVTGRNNLILSRVGESSTDSDLVNSLQEVIKSSISANDHYNVGRAVVRLAKFSIKRDIKISVENINHLMKSYKYFYSQRLDSLFFESHKALWSIFEKAGDVRNLLSLFKTSSFIWRLNGKDEREKPYLEKMATSATTILGADILTADQDTAYFVLRVQQLRS